jgi:hypothetical protein
MQAFSQSLGYRCGRYLHKHTHTLYLQLYFQHHYEPRPPGSTSAHYLYDENGEKE